jgi:toxin ParE1/3/4
MAKIKWTNLAIDDLKNINDYYFEDSPKYAERLIDKIILKVDFLITNPKIGRKVPEFDKEFLRELIEGNYRIIYRLDSEIQISIVRIHHSSKELKNI